MHTHSAYKHPSTVCIIEVMIIEITTSNLIFNVIFLYTILLHRSPELLVQKFYIPSLSLFWCPYMVINVSVQYNGGLLPDIILLTLCDYIGEPF